MNHNSLKNFVVFTSSERRGIIILLLLTIASFLFSYFVPNWISNKQIESFEKNYACFLEEARQNTSQFKANFKKKSTYNDSNQSVADEFSIKTSKSISTVQKPLPEHININTISIDDLKRYSWIEPEIAYRIIKFRQSLGGFNSIEQLNQVFGMTEPQYQKLKETIVLEIKEPKKININTDDFESLVSNPYVSPKLANQIINFRTKFKPFESNEDVRKLYLIDEELYKKIIPYILYN